MKSYRTNSCFEAVLFLGFSVIGNLYMHCVLYNLSLCFLCIPAIAASLEHSFSSAGLTESALRSRLIPILNLLTGSQVRTLNLLHCNQAFFELPVSTGIATKKKLLETIRVECTACTSVHKYPGAVFFHMFLKINRGHAMPSASC